jgi:hypothetical protein
MKIFDFQAQTMKKVFYRRKITGGDAFSFKTSIHEARFLVFTAFRTDTVRPVYVVFIKYISGIAFFN